ncbi:hypothetical protein FPQ18DRAFT_396911 [Pyronema domesticum]|nr:hypothetical protein FPQ18DRAFT_396911 [Pyronema domesticum]
MHYNTGLYQAISGLHTLTAQLVNQKKAREQLLNESILQTIEQKVQVLTEAHHISDDAVRDGLRQQLYYRAYTSHARKEAKRRAEVANKVQEVLDSLDDTDDDGDYVDTTMDAMLRRVQQSSATRNPRVPNEADWQGEYVSNVLKDAQRKFRQKLEDQKEKLRKEYEAEAKRSVEEAQALADEKCSKLKAESDRKKTQLCEIIDKMNQAKAHIDAEKDSTIQDLKEDLSVKDQALDKAYRDFEQEREFRKKLHDALEVLHHTEGERKQELLCVKMESEKMAQQIRDLQQQLSNTTAISGGQESEEYDRMTDTGAPDTPTSSSVDGSYFDGQTRAYPW